ncbi:MAG: signal peptidase I [Verrucomicrobiota bacterium]
MLTFLQERRGLIGFALLLLLLPAALITAFQQRWLVLFHMNDSQAMWPTIQTDDLVLAETITRRFFEPQSGQMIIFNSAGIEALEDIHGHDPPWLYVQRLVAKTGDSVHIARGELNVNGETWVPAVWDGQIKPGPFLPESQSKTIPEQCYFVIADHYRVAQDSRHWGWVPRENLVACVLWIFRASD